MSAKDIRNIVLLGHGGSGKTTLAESMLFMTGGTDRFGKVTDGNTTCDYDAEEIKRNISISLAVAPVKYKNVKINVLDTPGNFDFAGEVLSGIRAAECAVLVCGAKDGLSVGAERAWKMLGNKPRMIFINRTDEENSDYNACFDALKGKFGTAVAPIVAPIIDGSKKVTGIVDLLHNKAYEVKGGKAAECAIPADIAEQLKVVWEGADNPVRTLKQGDSLRLVFERKFAGGDFIRNGQLLAVQVVSGEDVHEAYWFENDSRAGGFYTLAGRASQQTFMRVPLDVKDVSSEFAPLRRHPVTGVVRPHNGTDFRAPSGSRIFAAADGVVTFVGYERKGYGRYVKIDHGLGRTTLYAHMSRITKNLRAGQKVERGDVIGYVGRTGLATGPHLHYELMFDGVQINPRTADLPDTENLTAFQVAQLKTIARPIQARFDLLAESESLPVPTVLRTHRDDATAVAKHLLGDEEQAEGASRVAHRVTSMKED